MTDKEYSAEELEAAVNSALTIQATSNISNEGIRSRIAAMTQGGYDFADTLHNVYLDYGYPAQLHFFNYWNMYRRFGIAKNVVEMVPDKAWITPPEIDGAGADFDKIVKRLNLWHKLKGLDTRQRVGRYAGLFMRVADGKKPEEELEGKLSGEAALVDVTPLYESQLRVTENDNDHQSVNFGKPKMYQFSSAAVGDRDDQSATSFNIHPSRLIMAAEGADAGNIYGISSLEAGYNSLMDLRKIIGGGGEGFYKNAAQTIVFEIEDVASAAKNAKQLKGFGEEYDSFSRDRMRRSLMAPGMKAQALDSSLISPKEFFAVALNDVAASVPIPATILIGQQTGRLASDEDSDAFAASVQSRRVNFLSHMVGDVVDWMMKFGIVATAQYEVVWDDLLALSDEDRLKNGTNMAGINEKQFKSGALPAFSSEEIRVASGFDEPVEGELPTPDETLEGDE